MKNYGNEQALELLREAINISARGEMWHHKHMLWAQSKGLQGHKRLNRYESTCDRAHYIKIPRTPPQLLHKNLQGGWTGQFLRCRWW